ncbi:MAG: hypothetical protein CME65_14850 [Halobacteriovoraceae bacterium]|nr:hypothetical protein [Halobacteriovoraceae bacterium]|tara:strand:+ start:5802 stop:6497 length:696 start_codon:yes stop_codon:yes gene_type:complete
MKLLFLILILVSFKSFALEWESGTDKSYLIELYTSESCSSCPPAERWLNKIKESSSLYQSIVPVEYHVDYWNYLNWEDKHSDNKYTRRQRQFAQKRKTSVFTPQILQNGSLDLKYTASYPIESDEKAPNLKVKLNQNSGKVVLEVNRTDSLLCEAAVTQGGFKTKIKSGENSGKTLKHEFVVKELQTTSLKNKKCEFSFSNLGSAGGKGIALWLRSPESFKVIQATGRKLD